MFRTNESIRMNRPLFGENGTMLTKDKDLFNSHFSSIFTNEMNDTIEVPVKHYQKGK